MHTEERTFIAVKPDGVQRGLIGEVIKKQDYTLKIGDKKYYNYNELDLYNHFGEEEWTNFH